MSQPIASVHEIRWNEICPWLILVRALRVSLLVRVLLLAWAGVMLTQWGWLGFGKFADGDGNALPNLIQNATASSPEESTQVGEASILPNESLPWNQSWNFGYGPLQQAWSWLTNPLVRIFSSDRTWKQCFILGLCGVWAIIVWGLLGGAIVRIAALQLTRGETLGPLAAVQAALPKWPTLIVAPLIPLSFAMLLGIPLLLAGLLLRLDVSALLVGLGWGLALMFGAVLATLLIGLMIGWPFIWATVGVERTDALDGVSRAYSYVYQRPFHLVFYLVVATVLGAFGQMLVQFFADATMQMTQWATSWGAGNERMAGLLATPTADATGMASTASGAIGFWQAALSTLVASYPLALLWSMSVGIYLLMRRHIDSTEMDEVALDEGEPTEGLPPLESHKSGVPGMAKTERNDE